MCVCACMHACDLCKFKQKSYFYVHSYVFMIHFGNHTLFFLSAFPSHSYIISDIFIWAQSILLLLMFQFSPFFHNFFLLLFLLLTSHSICVLQQQKACYLSICVSFHKFFPFFSSMRCVFLFDSFSVLCCLINWCERKKAWYWCDIQYFNNFFLSFFIYIYLLGKTI